MWRSEMTGVAPNLAIRIPLRVSFTMPFANHLEQGHPTSCTTRAICRPRLLQTVTIEHHNSPMAKTLLFAERLKGFE